MTKRVALVDIALPEEHVSDVDEHMAEFRSLIKTLGGIEVVKIIQHRTHPHPATYIGSGKAIELLGWVKELHIDAVIINDLVKPTQLFRLTRALWPSNPDIQVWDRVDLILNIFDKHATTAEAKLQIEIARMQHMGPRAQGLGGNLLSRQGGGVGSRGEGETNTELMKRHWKELIRKKNEELNKYNLHRASRLERRQNQGIKTVAIVGYTNAGKTTLFNALTQKKKLAKDALFATLDSVTGKVYSQKLNNYILYTDTIGFIRNLPPTLIQAFRSTLFEASHADVLLLVIDISDSKYEEKIDVVIQTLKDIGASHLPTIMVFNKADMVSPTIINNVQQSYAAFTTAFVSAQTGSGLSNLLEAVTHSIISHGVTPISHE